VEVTVDNPFLFTGQYFDAEINQYYLRARQYDPQLYRFTSRDPIRGRFTEPLELHRYLYCLNEPVNQFDPSGKFAQYALIEPILAGHSVRSFSIAVTAVGATEGNWNIMTYGFGLSHAVGPVMALSYGSYAFKGGMSRQERDLLNLIGEQNAYGNSNLQPGAPLLPPGTPRWIVAGTFISLLLYECKDGVIEFWDWLWQEPDCPKELKNDPSRSGGG